MREILVNGENLLHLINGLLDLEKIESGKMEISIGPILMTELLDRVHRMILSLLQKKGHAFDVEIPKDFPIVYADERKVQQILLNLVSNAIKFTPNGGRISVAVKHMEEGGVEQLEVSVADTGIGIHKKDISTVFESFRQVDSSFTREYQGTGLGLALVKQFVEILGGTIHVESEIGRGSRFIFTIPSSNPE